MMNEALPEHLRSQPLDFILLEMRVAVRVHIDGLGTIAQSNPMARGSGRWHHPGIAQHVPKTVQHHHQCRS